MATCSLLVLVLALLGSATMYAQSTQDGGISGTVTDQTEAVVAGATITAVNVDTNEQFTGKSDEVGAFRVIHLRPGTYNVSIAASSFTPFRAERIVVEVGLVTNLAIRLSVGGAQEQVEVTGEAPVINTVQADFTNNINSTTLNELPIFARRWSTFALMTPGASADGQYGLVAFRGISGLLNNNTVDGGDNNNAYWSEERGRTRATATLSQDSIREFQVNNSNFSAEYGRAAGGVVNAVTKSGTNQIHGGGHLYATDSAMWAYNPFSTQTVITNGVKSTVPLKPDDRRWVFGANVGGALVKDKLFYFFNWDQQKENAPGVATPDPSFFTPITVAMPASCSAKTLTAGQVLACRGITQAQSDAALGFLASLTGPVSRNKDQWVIFPKIDWRINNKHTATFDWNHMRWNSLHGIQTAAVVGYGKASWGDDFVNVDTGNARLISLFTDTLTNELRVSIGKEHQFENSNPPAAGEPTTGPGGRPPYASISGPVGSFNIGKANFLERAALPLEDRQQVADTMSKLLGKHLFKWGADINHSSDYISNLFQEGGQFNYSNLQDYISDYTTWKTGTAYCGTTPKVGCYSSFNQGIGPKAFSFSTMDYAFFVQDEWHVARTLTLNLGLRYDNERLPKAFWPNSNYPATGVTPSDNNNLAPRVGVAWDVLGDGKTVVRGGYGMYFGRVINSYISNELTGTGSPQSQLSTGNISASSSGAPLYPNVLANALPSGAAPALNVYGAMRNPLAHEADLVVEREITHNTVVSFSYLLSIGRDLPMIFDRNLSATSNTITYSFSGGPLDGQTATFPFYTGSRPNTAFNNINSLEYVGKSRYDGQVFAINRRLTNGLQLQASYTHARTTDTNPNGGTGATSMSVVDPFHPQVDYGTSSFDIRHRFGFAAVYQPRINSGSRVLNALVNGFQVSPMMGITSGAPLNGSISGNAPQVGTLKRTNTGLLGDGGVFRLPNLPKYGFRMPTTAFGNLRLARTFTIREGKTLQVLVDGFNLSNHLDVTSVNTTLYSIPSTPSSYAAGSVVPMTYNALFGAAIQANNQDRVGSTVRQFQFGARFTF
ncbi:MAG TPA: TonB-dependent receptor [Terriglobales bacterium]|nr:TonB-dependent receptor [Terriglobales bacterium]